MTQTTSRNFTTEFLIEVTKGNIPKHTYLHKFGSISAVTTTLTPVSTAGAYQTPTALTSLEIVSSDNVNDIAGGTGALTVTIIGIGTGWTELTETVTLNGTTAVALANQYYRIYRAHVASSGSYATSATPSHNSTITIRVSGAGATWATIIPDGTFGLGQTQIACYTVPLGKTAYFLGDHISVEANKTVNIYRFFRESANDTTTPYSPMRVYDVTRVLANSSNHAGYQGPYTGPCDIGYLAASTAGTANVEVDFQLLLIDS